MIRASSFPANTPGIGPAMRALSDPKSSREVRTAAKATITARLPQQSADRTPMIVGTDSGAIRYNSDGTKRFLTAAEFTAWLAEQRPQFHADNPPFTDRQITLFIFGGGAAFWGILWLIGAAVDALHAAGRM